MRNQRKYNPIQLCLFSPKEMADMTEAPRPIKERSDMEYADWVLWELSLLPALTGQGYRDQIKFLTGKVKPILSGQPVVESIILRSYDAIIDRLRPTVFLY